MGQVESAGDVSPPCTPPEETVTRMRQDYLHRLGIQRDKKAGFPRTPVSIAEAPDRLETTPNDMGHIPEPEAPRASPSTAPSVSTATASFSAGLAAEPSGSADGTGGFEMNVLDLRSKDDFRLNFLKKLSYQRVWVPQAQRPPQHQTVIIFDWDDTLLCTSFLNFRQDSSPQPVVERYLKGIEKAAIKLLEQALRLGRTFIITNAMTGWVEYSAAKYVPGLLPVLQRVRVVSARGNFEAQYPGEVSQWKIQAFLEVKRELDSQIITNLISLGDSNFEMDAVHVMGKEFEQAMIKTIKFRDNPSPEELLKQLELVAQKFEKIALNARNLKIGLERKWVGAAAPQPT